jgi:hypothetical protein
MVPDSPLITLPGADCALKKGAPVPANRYSSDFQEFPESHVPQNNPHL